MNQVIEPIVPKKKVAKPSPKQEVSNDQFLDSWARINAFASEKYKDYTVELDVISVTPSFCCIKGVLLKNGKPIRDAVVANASTGEADDLFVNATSTMAYGKVLAFAGIGGSPMRLGEEQNVWLSRLKAQARDFINKDMDAQALALANSLKDQLAKKELTAYVSALISQKTQSQL